MSLFDLFSKQPGASADPIAADRRRRSDLLANAQSYLAPQASAAPSLSMAKAPDPFAALGGSWGSGGMSRAIAPQPAPQAAPAAPPLPTPPPMITNAGNDPDRQRRQRLFGLAAQFLGSNGLNSGIDNMARQSLNGF